MDFWLYLEKYQKECGSGTEVSACVPAGCRELYLASKNRKEKDKLLYFLKRFADVCNEEVLTLGSTYFFLYDETEQEQYKEAVGVCRKRLWECLDEKSWQLISQMYPFYMQYETRCHNKAKYADIVRRLWELKTSCGASADATAWYLMTVISVMDYMSIEIFEHYKSLEEIFKKTIKNILENNSDKDFDKKESAMMGYSILKACNMGVLNSEKYAEVGRSMIDGVINEPLDPKDSEMVGIAMMAYAQYLTLNSN